MRTRNRFAATALVAAVVAAPSVAAYASDAPLVITPPTGPNTAFPVLTTTAPCPDGSTMYAGILVGPGLPADGQLAVLPSKVGFSTTSPFTVQMNYGFQDVASDAGLAQLKGVYTVQLRCQDDFGVVKGVFSGQVNFATPTAYTALGAAAGPPPAGARPIPGSAPTAAPTATPPGAGASAAPTPVATDAASPTGNPAVSAGATPATASVPGQVSSDSVSRLILALLAGGAAVALSFVALRRKPSDPPDSAADSPPDEPADAELTADRP